MTDRDYILLHGPIRKVTFWSSPWRNDILAGAGLVLFAVTLLFVL